MSCRRDYRDLTAAERARFVAALYHEKVNIDRRELLKCRSAVCRDDRPRAVERLTALVGDPGIASALSKAVRSVEGPR